MSEGRFLKPFERGGALGRTLLGITAAMVTLGTVFVASASEGEAAAAGTSVFSIMVRDVAYLALGVVAFYLAARVRLDRLVRSAPALAYVGVGLLVAVRLVGTSSNGGTRWLNLKVIQLQPSELFKLFTILFVAWLIERHHRELGDWRRVLVLSWPILVGGLLVVAEPDLGTASVVFCLALVMLWMVGLPRRFFVAVGVVGVAGFVLFMKIKPYSAQRLTAFLHPNANLLTSGYQLFQSKIGLGAGGLTGLGLGHSREKYGLLPNAHTDFIFTVIGEELGLVGTLCVLALFVAFLVTAVRIAQRSPHGTYRLIVVGITTWIMVEAVINVASVVGWWAVTGVPLPFFSYGGTALIVELFAVGLLYNVAHDRSRAPDLVVAESAGPRGRVHRPTGAPSRPRVAPSPRRAAPARRAPASGSRRGVVRPPHAPAPRRYRPEG